MTMPSSDMEDIEPDAYGRTGEREECWTCGGTGIDYGETCIGCGGFGWTRAHQRTDNSNDLS